MSFREFRFPRIYVQGENAILETKRYLYPFGSRFLFVLGCGPITEDVKNKINRSFREKMVDNVQEQHPVRRGGVLRMAEARDKENKNFEYEFLDYDGKEVTHERIQEVADYAMKFGADMVIGIGGGKALDLVRGQGHITGIPTSLMPTAAATNAPGTRLHVVYKEDGSEIVDCKKAENYSELLLADTALIINAPARSISAGIGDCIGTCYEGLLTAKEQNSRDYSSSMGWAALLDGERAFREQGVAAYLAAKAKTITNDFNIVVEHLILGNGLWSGAVGSMNLAHVLDELLLCFESCRKFMHGELVGYAVLPMWVKEGRPLQDMYDYIDFCQQLTIPVTLEQMGIGNVSTQELIDAAEVAMKSIVFSLTPTKLVREDLYQNMLVANEIATSYLARK